jgi:hypothetical protein
MTGPNSTDKLSHEDRRILERKVDLGIDRRVEVTSQPVPQDVTPDEVVSPTDRTTNLITGYGDYVDYINQLLAKIKVKALGLRYDVVSDTEPGLYAALNALWEGGKTHISYSDYVDALEFEASVSQEIISKGEGGETSYLEQLRGSAAEVSAGFEAKLLADNNPQEEAGEALLSRPLIVARTMAESQSVNLQKFGSSEPRDDEEDDGTVEIYGKEVINTFTKIAAGEDPAQTILDDCIPCLDRALDMDLQAPLNTFLDDIEADLDTRWSILQNIADLLDSDDIYEDICDLLDFFSFQCVPDLVAILSLLLWYYKSLIVSFSLDISGSLWTLLGMIMGPFFSTMESVIDQYISMLMAPVDCIIDSLLYQMSKIPSLSTDYEFLLGRQKEQAAFRARAAVGDTEIANINTSIDSALNTLALRATPWKQSQETGATPLTPDYVPSDEEIAAVPDVEQYLEALEKKQREQATVADYLRDTETVLETGLGAIGGYLIEARDKLNSWLESLLEDIRAFLGGTGDDFTLAVSYATTIKRLARLIGFIKALIKMADDGLQCGPERNLSEPDVLGFLRNYLAPELGVEVVIDDNNNVVIVPPETPTVQTTTTRDTTGAVVAASGEAPALEEGRRGITVTLSDCINKVDIADLRKVDAWIKEISN